MRRIGLALYLILVSLVPGLAQEPQWNPSETQAVVVGVLRWQNPNIPGFSAELRQDQLLAETLLARGVPENNLHLLLDEQATLENILRALKDAASQTSPDGTLIFYYAGHGVKDQKGKIKFLNYDHSPTNSLDMQIISDTIARDCKGQVILLADCCYSGGLRDVVEEIGKANIPSFCLTSATHRIPSKANWTFTMSLIDALEGKRSADPDFDRKITVSQLRNSVTEDMKYYERQESGYYNQAFPEETVLTYVTTLETRPLLPAPYKAYQWTGLKAERTKINAKLVGYDQSKFRAQSQSYNTRPIRELAQDRLLPIPAKPELIPSERALEAASADGKYSKLLEKIEVEYDYLGYGAFNDYGYFGPANYNGYENLPPGYWVYVYPHWFIWGTAAEVNRQNPKPATQP